MNDLEQVWYYREKRLDLEVVVMALLLLLGWGAVSQQLRTIHLWLTGHQGQQSDSTESESENFYYPRGNCLWFPTAEYTTTQKGQNKQYTVHIQQSLNKNKQVWLKVMVINELVDESVIVLNTAGDADLQCNDLVLNCFYKPGLMRHWPMKPLHRLREVHLSRPDPLPVSEPAMEAFGGSGYTTESAVPLGQAASLSWWVRPAMRDWELLTPDALALVSSRWRRNVDKSPSTQSGGRHASYVAL